MHEWGEMGSSEVVHNMSAEWGELGVHEWGEMGTADAGPNQECRSGPLLSGSWGAFMARGCVSDQIMPSVGLLREARQPLCWLS